MIIRYVRPPIYNGENLNLYVLSRFEVKTYDPPENSILITITNPEKDFTELEFANKYVDILKLKFDDIENNQANKIVFDDNMAIRILEFVKKYKDQIDLLVINCEAGISRSAGVAAALSLIYNYNDKYFYQMPFSPNSRVKRTIVNLGMGRPQFS